MHGGGRGCLDGIVTVCDGGGDRVAMDMGHGSLGRAPLDDADRATETIWIWLSDLLGCEPLPIIRFIAFIMEYYVCEENSWRIPNEVSGL